MTVLVTSLIAVYVFNPGIGMSRNWDLFSIIGPPLVLLAYAVVLESDADDNKRYATATLIIALSLLTLVPRVVALNKPDIAIQQFKNNIELDRVRNRYARTLLITYYEKNGDNVAAENERRLTLHEFPEEANVGRAKSLVQARRYQEAITLLRSVLKANPINYHAYTNLGAAFREMKQVDSAVYFLEIANGLNPYSKSILANLAAAYLDSKRFADAVTTFEESFALGNDETIWHYYAARAYRGAGDIVGFERELRIAATHPDSPAYVMNELGDFYLSQQDYTEALKAYREAIARGMDSTYLQQLLGRYPALAQ
jgi:tetratricopeptide (TPR) repeat protein